MFVPFFFAKVDGYFPPARLPTRIFLCTRPGCSVSVCIGQDCLACADEMEQSKAAARICPAIAHSRQRRREKGPDFEP
jgi:hypothetical protein